MAMTTANTVGSLRSTAVISTMWVSPSSYAWDLSSMAEEEWKRTNLAVVMAPLDDGQSAKSLVSWGAVPYRWCRGLALRLVGGLMNDLVVDWIWRVCVDGDQA